MKRTALARALSKLGFCSRSLARELIDSGRVRVNGQPSRDPERWVVLERDRIEVDAQLVRGAEKLYLMLNKPRGLVTTARDEKGRPTVFKCFEGAALPLPGLGAVGRLDKASEGLLLFTNDTAWADRITDPGRELEKVYHVQVDCLADEHTRERMRNGIEVDGELLAVRCVGLLRQGTRHCWLEIVLTEGKNRHIRRLLAALGIEVLRLVRVRIGSVELGDLPKGAFRMLTESEVRRLAG